MGNPLGLSDPLSLAETLVINVAGLVATIGNAVGEKFQPVLEFRLRLECRVHLTTRSPFPPFLFPLRLQATRSESRLARANLRCRQARGRSVMTPAAKRLKRIVSGTQQCSSANMRFGFSLLFSLGVNAFSEPLMFGLPEFSSLRTHFRGRLLCALNATDIR